MLTVSVLWVVLSVVVTVAAMPRRSNGNHRPERAARESGRALAIAAVAFSLALVAGFVYVSRFFVSGL
jgi:heme/copper-type cytochrome/quinol oxidase subunit 2